MTGQDFFLRVYGLGYSAWHLNYFFFKAPHSVIASAFVILSFAVLHMKSKLISEQHFKAGNRSYRTRLQCNYMHSIQCKYTPILQYWANQVKIVAFMCAHSHAHSRNVWVGNIVSFPDPTLEEGKGSGMLRAFLGFADSTVQEPELPIRFEACDFSCDIG